MSYFKKFMEPFFEEADDLSGNNPGVAEPDAAESNNDNLAELNLEGEKEQELAKPVQSDEDNAKYAAIRRDAERKARESTQKAIDAEYSRLYGAEYGIHSKADYDAYLERQRLIEEGKDPEVHNLKNKVELFEFRDKINSQRETLRNDPNNGDLFKEWEPELNERMQLYEQMFKDRQINQRVDLETAFTLMWKEKGPKIISELKQKMAMKQEIDNANKDSAARSTGSVSGKGQVPNGFFTKDQVANMSQKEILANFEAIQNSKKNW